MPHLGTHTLQRKRVSAYATTLHACSSSKTPCNHPPCLPLGTRIPEGKRAGTCATTVPRLKGRVLSGNTSGRHHPRHLPLGTRVPQGNRAGTHAAAIIASPRRPDGELSVFGGL